MMTLERMIKRMTITTPSGGRFNIGKACITVSYCPDYWEWEYLGETYWDVQDLSEAIVLGSRANPQARPRWSKWSKVQERTLRSKHPVMVSFLEARREMTGVLPFRRPFWMVSVPPRGSVSESSTVLNRHFAKSVRESANPILIPYVTPIDKSISHKGSLSIF